MTINIIIQATPIYSSTTSSVSTPVHSILWTATPIHTIIVSEYII